MGLDLTGLGSVANLAETLVNKFLPDKMSDADKAQVQVQVQNLLQKRDDNLLAAQRDIIVAEMSQGDNFTKRARPAIVYCGLAAIGIVHVFFPVIAWICLTLKGSTISLPSIALPGEFWAAWGGVCSIWVIGRSAEKRGAANKITEMITGKTG